MPRTLRPTGPSLPGPLSPPAFDLAHPATRARWLDIALAILFLSLTFLLGIFPLHDTDFWWHLRTGDLIRDSGNVPRVDPYLFGGAADKPWIDLHWLFQVLLSFGYELGGIDLLNLAKCAITTAGVALLLFTRRPGWPLWIRILAWIPPLLLLAGRMYVRPETLSFLYMSIFLSVIFHWRARPALALLLPFVQLLWVNTQGLFVLGPVLLVFGFLDLLLLREPPELGRRGWSLILGSCLAVGLACLINPYGLRGALFPLELLGTMGNPIFESIGELKPLPTFIREASWSNVPLRIHLSCLALGVASFLLPILGRIVSRLRSFAPSAKSRASTRTRRATNKVPKSKLRAAATENPTWRLRPFRLLLFVTFGILSWKATRNSHQFAAITGAVSAWNFGEWAASWIRTQHDSLPGYRKSHRASVFVLAILSLLIVFVASGRYYAWLGEGRAVGLGEQPLVFPHAAARLSQSPGMPDRSVCFHNGHSAVWIYHNGPDKKTYADARLEVIGPALYQEYHELQQRLALNRGWEERLAEMGNPSLLLDLSQLDSALLTARALDSPHWSCIHFDPIASVFVHRSFPASQNPVDFSRRHFEPDPSTDPADSPSRVALARICRDLAAQIETRLDLAAQLNLLGRGYAHRALLDQGVESQAWKRLGLLEQQRLRLTPTQLSGRFRAPFDPLLDPPLLRATYALESAREDLPDDFSTLVTLLSLYQAQGLTERAYPIADRIVSLTPRNPTQRLVADSLRPQLPALRDQANAPIAREWSNLNELNSVVERLLNAGQAQVAAEVLALARPALERSWAETDRLATLWLRLSTPATARIIWQSARNVPRPALQNSRVGWTYLIEEDYTDARNHFEQALFTEPALFEAAIGLALLELDAGHREPAIRRIDDALKLAPDSASRAQLQEWRELADPR